MKLEKALEKQKKLRIQSARDLEKDLQNHIIVSAKERNMFSFDSSPEGRKAASETSLPSNGHESDKKQVRFQTKKRSSDKSSRSASKKKRQLSMSSRKNTA